MPGQKLLGTKNIQGYQVTNRECFLRAQPQGLAIQKFKKVIGSTGTVDLVSLDFNNSL